ncbi:MAG: carbohydrate-binding family 9-like protein [Victivallales bacterium]|nr:carbohydrate-binding family 9-like protein [Victivallales bacterium]
MKKLCLVLFVLCLGCLAADPVYITAGRGTPEIDGNLGDAAWKESIACGPFLLNLTNSFAQQQTTVSFLWDDENLYVAFKCMEGALDPLQNRLHDFKNGFQETDSDKVYSSDMVEVLLGNGANNKLYDVIVSASGVVCDCVSSLDAAEYWSNRDHSWQSNAKVAVGIDNGGKNAHWRVEMALPWSALGGVPKMGDSWKVLASRRECASKEQSSLQAIISGGIHLNAYLGKLVFLERVPGICITSFPEFLPGPNALKVAKTNEMPAHLNGSAAFDRDVIRAKQQIGKERGELPFNLDKSGDFVFSWYLSQGSTVYFRSPDYKCHVNTRVLEAKLNQAELTVNGVVVSGSLPLKTGVNEFELKAGEGAEVALTVAGTSIPYPEGWIKGKDGVERLSVLCEKSVVWPNWHVNGIYLNRGGLQQILYFPQGIPGKKVSDYTMTFELPKGITLVGVSGYYNLFPLETRTAGTVVRDGVEFTKYAITVKKTIPYIEQRKSHEMIAVLIAIDEAIAMDETQIFYYADSKQGNAFELPNSFAAHIIAPARGVQPKDAYIEMWGGWHKSMDDAELKRKVYDYMADAGVNEITGGLTNYTRLKGVILFNFAVWNFNCEEYIKAHPEQAQVEYSGKVSKLVVCSRNMVKNPDFAAFLKKNMKPWHERWGSSSHIDWDYEEPVKNSYMSCYCKDCLTDFASFAGISAEGLTSENVNKEHLEKWQAYCHRRVADFAALLCRTIHEELPGVLLSVYSGYQSDRTKLIYGIDWSLMEGMMDIAMCGYGRTVKDLKETQACFKKTRLVLGELVYPYKRELRIAPQAARASTLMRRCCDATKGFLIYEYPTLDGRSFLAISEVSKVLSKYEPFFTTGIRVPEMLKMPGVDAAEYEVLGDGQGNFLVVLMNMKDKPRDYSFEVTLPDGKQLYNDNGKQLGNKVTVTVDGFKTNIFVIK